MHFSFLTSFLYPYLRVFGHPCRGKSIFLHLVLCFLFHHRTYWGRSVCVSPHLPSRGIDVDHGKLCHWPSLPVAQQTPSLPPLPFCHLLHYVSWGAEEPRSGHGTPDAASWVPKGREELSTAFHMHLAIIADSCSTLCLPGPPCLCPQKFPVDSWSQHVGLSGVTLA